MVNLFDVLKGLEKGISEADSNLGIYQETLSKREAAKLENLLKKAKLHELLAQESQAQENNTKLRDLTDEFYRLYSESDDGIKGKAQEKLGDWGLMSSETHEKRKQANLIREELISQIIAKKGLPKNKQVYESIRKEITPTTNSQIPSLKKGVLDLLGLEGKASTKERQKIIQKEETEEPLIEMSDQQKGPSIWERLKNWGGHLKEEWTATPMQATKDTIGSLPKFAGKLMKGGHNIQLMLHKKLADALIGEDSKASHFLDRSRKDLNEFYDKAGDHYNSFLGLNPESSSSDVGEIIGSFAVPAARLANPLASAALNAVGFGALSKAAEGEELEDIIKNIPKDAGVGLALSALPTAITKHANKKTDLLLKGSTRTPEEALRLQKKVAEKGGKLSLGHVLNEQTTKERFEKANLPFSGTKKDLRKTKAAIEDISRDLETKYPNDPRELGKSLQKNFKKAQERASLLYEEAAGLEGVKDLVLSPDQLEKVIQGSTRLKNTPSVTQTPEVYNLSVKEGDKVNRLIQKEFNQVRRDLQKAWNKGNPTEEYFQIYRRLGLPNYLDIQDYYHNLNTFAKKQGLFSQQPDTKLKSKWYETIDPVKSVIQDMDKTGKFKGANTFFKKEVLPYKKEKSLWESMEILKDSDTVAPIFKFFAEEGNVNAEKIFNQLTQEDKRRVIGMMLHKNRAIDTPLIRNVYREEKKLPFYIENSKDPYVRSLVEELQDAARLNTNLSQIQGAIKTKGSGAETDRLTNAFLSHLISGGVSSAKTLGTLGTGGIYQNLRRRYETNPKTLEKYLSPETLKAIRDLRARQTSEFLIKSKKKGEQDDNK